MTDRALWCGFAGAVSFVAVFLVNDAIKPDYEPYRDFVSEAAIGRGGWVQIANFLIAGILLTLSSWYCRLTGVAVAVLFMAAGGVQASAGLWQRLSILAGWSWLAVLHLRAMTEGRP